MKKKLKILMSSAIAVSIVFTGCGTKKVSKDDTPTVTWYVPALIEGANKAEVYNQVNKMLMEKYQMKLDLIGIDGGNFAQKMQVMNAGQEEYDLAFTSHWQNNYYSNVSNGVFCDITDLLNTDAKDLYSSMQKNIWDSVKVDGKIYAVPNWQIQAKCVGLYVPESKLQKTGLTMNNFSKYEDVETYLRKLKEVEPDSNKLGGAWTWLINYYGMVELYEELMPGAISYTKDGKPIVINQYDTQEFTDYYNLRHKWVSEGLTGNNFLTDTNAEKKEIQQCPFMIHVYKPSGEAEANRSRGYNALCKPLSSSVLTTSGITAAMTGVSATSKNPKAAIKMLEIMNTNADLYNLVCWGIEGKDFEKVSDTKIKIPETKGYSGVSNWIIGSVANSYLLENQEDGVWEETKDFNDSAVLSPVLGFNADVSKFSSELSNCKNVVNEYFPLLDLGLKDEKALADFRNALKVAGVDTIISELQAQVDEWWKTK